MEETMKKRTGRDSRQEGTVEAPEGAMNFRVDRVFPSSSPPVSASVTPRQAMSPSTASLMSSARSRRATATPLVDAESELSLRRQLSRLQRQLADAQRDLANKDDELAAEVEKRAEAVDAHESLVEEFKLHKAHLDELLSYRARTTGMEEQLQAAVVAADELAHQLEHERGKVASATIRCDELQAQFDDARSRWTAERLRLDSQYAEENAALETSKRTALDAAEVAMTAALERLRAGHEEEMTQLRAAHERSVAALRGELEPQALEARNLAEECERLTSELAARAAEAVRVNAEMTDSHQRDLTQLSEVHTGERATLVQRHSTELARVVAERDENAQAIEQAARAAEVREQYWESAVASMRDAQKKLQRDLADAKARIAELDSEIHSLNEQLATASATAAHLGEDNDELVGRVQAAEAEARRNALDRARFFSYLEEGLALLGSPPSDVDADK
jgi:chromosome segregation ATPase